MTRHVRDRIEQLEVASANRSRQCKSDEGEWLEALREVALAGFPVFRDNLIAFSKVRSAQATEDFASLAVGFHEKVHPGREFRHQTQDLLAVLGVIDPMEDPICWCGECYGKFRTQFQS